MRPEKNYIKESSISSGFLDFFWYLCIIKEIHNAFNEIFGIKAAEELLPEAEVKTSFFICGNNKDWHSTYGR